MYAKKIQLINYGPIESLEIECPFDGGKPHPIVLVGENGSGKSILLSHIVNGLLCAQQAVYPGTPEVRSGKVYKLRSPLYIRNGERFAFARVEFERNISVAELQLPMRRKDYANAPQGILDTDAEQLWNSIDLTENSNFALQLDDMQAWDLFQHNCILYFPPNRFEEPAWLNNKNMVAKARHIDPMQIGEGTNRTVLNYSPLRDNESFLFALAFDFGLFETYTREINVSYHGHNAALQNSLISVFEGHSGCAKTLYDTAIQVVQVITQGQMVRFGIGSRGNRLISVIDNEQVRTPNIFQMSSGEISLLNIFLSILRDFDSCQTQLVKPEDIRGIVVIDEVDLHLHATHQYTILPQLIQMFPRVQFVLTTHSPLFILGLQRVLSDDSFGLYRLPSGERISPEEFSEFENAYRVFAQTNTHLSEMREAIRRAERPLILVEGKTDVEYLNRAMQLLGWYDTCIDVDIRDAGGEGNLNQAWKTFTKVDVVRQTVVLLYDCDSPSKPDNRGSVFRRKMSMFKDTPIRKGIENLFSEKTLNRAKACKPEFIDIAEKHEKMVRGQSQEIPETWEVNKDEKRNLCNWICQNGTQEDFRGFEEILGELRNIPGFLRLVTDELG